MTEVAKQQLEEEGEDTADYIVQTVSKTQKKIAQLTKTSSNKDGVNVLDPNGNLRDTYDILLDIAKVYKEIQSDDQKYGTNRANAIVEYIAGKNRSNIAASILQNPGLLEDVYETAKNSEGSAIQENEKYLDSIAGKMQQLTNSAQEFATEFLDSEVVKGVTGLLADIVQLGTKGVSSFNALQIAATAFFGVIGAKNLDMKHIKDVFLADKAQYGTGNAILAQFGLGQHKRDKAAFSNFKAEYEAISNGIIGPVPQDEALKLVSKHMKDASSAATLLTEKVAKQKITMDEASESLKNMSFKSRLAGVGWSILGGAISSVLGLAISSVISILVEQITASGEAAKQAAENVNKFNEAYSDSHQKLSEASRTIDEVKEEYFELSKGVSESGENLSLSNSQYSRYKAIVEQLSGVMPNLTTLFNEQGEAIGFAGGKIDDFNNKLLEMQQNLARKNLYGDDGQQNALNDAVTVFNKKFSQEIENKTGPFMNWITAGGNADISLFSNKNEVLDFLKLLSESSPQQILENLNTQIDTSSVGGMVDSLVNSPKEANLKAFKNYIKEYIGLTDEEIEKLVTNNPNELINRLRSSYDKLKAELDNDVISLRNAMKDYVTVGYQNLNLDDKKIADGIIDAFNPQDLKDRLGKDTLEDSDITSWINNMVNTIESHHEEVSSAFTGLFKLDISDMPVEEARQAIEDFIAILASWFPDLDIGKLLEKAGLNGFYNNTVPAYERAIAIGSDGEYTDENGIHRKITGRNIASKEEIRDAMINRGINTDEEINAWTEAEQTATNMTDLLNKYNQIINNSKESTKSFGRVWAELNDSVKDSDKSTIEELKELASTGKLTADVIEEKYMTAFKDTGLSAEELAKKINSLVDEIKRLATLEAGINNIQEVFKEKKEAKDKKPKEQSLDALGDKLEVSTWKGKDLKVWKDYKKLAIDGNTSTKKMKKAQNELATSYARTHNFLAGLNEENKEYYINSLKEIGVKNAAQVVNSELIAQEWDLREAKLGGLTATFDLSTATDTEIQKLAGEAAQLGITKGQLFDYIVEKTAANSHGILTGGDISNLENLRTALGLATDDLIYYKKVKDWASQGGGTKYTKKGKNIYKGANGSATGVDYARRFGKVKTTTTSTPKRKKPKRDEWKLGDGKGGTNTNGGGGGGRGSGTDKSQKKTKEYIDWIERRITRISNIISKIGAQLENIGKWGSKFKKGKFLDLGALSNDTDNKRVSKMQARYKDEIKYYQNLYKVQEIAEKKYDKKAKNYATGKTAKKLFGKKGIPSKIMKRIKNGDTTLLSSGWYQKLSSDQKSLVDKVIDFYDKGRNAKQAKEEAASSARQAKEASYQAAQEKYDTRIGRAEAKEAMAVGYEKQNKFVKTQIDNMKKSYAQQIEIAKLEGNFAEAERLRYEAMQKEKELLVHELDNLAETYNLRRGINNRRIQDVDNLMNVAKARGTRTTLSWYNDKNLNEERNIASYQDEILKYEALADKNLAIYGKDSPEYQNALEHIQELENNIAQSNQNIAENTSALHDAWNQAYDDMRANNKRSADNLNTVIGFDRGENIDTIHRGADSYYRFTQSGLAKFGGANASYTAASNSAALSLEQYNLMKKANDDYQKATTEEEKQKILQDASVNSYEDLVKREQGYYDKYLSDRKDMYDAEQKIIDLMTDYYESQKTYLSELIDAKKKILDEEKDLYDYERNINEKTKSISDIQKQLAAIRGDNSEEGKARQQRLQNQLDEAQKALDDEEYNRWKTDQESMLDNLQTQFDDIIDKHLKEQNKLLNEGNELISQQGDAIQKAVGSIFTENSIPLSSDLADIQKALGTEGLGKVFTDLNSNISGWLKANGLGSTPTNSDGKDSKNDIETYGSYDAKYKDSDTILKTKNKNANKKADKLRQYHDMDEMYKSDISLMQSQIDKIEKKKKKTKQDKKNLAEYKRALADLKKGKKNNLAEWQTYQKTIRDDASKEYDEAGTLEGMLFSVISNDSINSNTTKKSATSALNRVLLGTYGYSVSEEALKALAEIFGFEADGSYSESGAAYQFFKTHKMAGFKTGGIGRLVKASGEDGIAMVRDGEGFIMPEHVPAMQNLLDITPQLDNIVNSVNKNGSGNINNFGGFTFELPNVTDARSLINEFQNSKDMQKLLKISVEDLVGKGTYSNRIHSV